VEREYAGVSRRGWRDRGGLSGKRRRDLKPERQECG
jgi:hypothetical protein